MLDDIQLTEKMTKEEYKEKVSSLKKELSILQHKVKEAGIPIVIIFEGWGAAGKGSLLSNIILTLDPRNFKTISTMPATSEEARRPFLWRHWQHLPENGLFSIYDRSWYPEIALDSIENNISKKIAQDRIHSVNTFEKQLTDHGTLVIKVFLHITKEEQKRRLDRLYSNKETRWRATKQDYKRNKNYNAIKKATVHMLEETNTKNAPWNIVSGHDKRKAQYDVYSLLVFNIRRALEKQEKPSSAKVNSPLSPGEFSLLQMPDLHEIFLGQAVEDKMYKTELKKLKKRLAQLHNELYRKKIPLVIVYEGWDAAGKGGNIHRLTSALDPRGYQVVPIAAPTPPEKNRHFLWRFWQHLPKTGHITIFDRSWYGRVLVERVEGFATSEEWQRAYREINEFENELCKWNAIVVKFWLEIDKDEQLKRFEDRQNTPEKQWKITEEDWRNREKWDEYQVVVNDMLRLTSTYCAPWTIIESQNKKYARLKTLETVIQQIEKALE